jgi:hypothetical protein
MGRSPLFEYFVQVMDSKKILPGYEGLQLRDRIRLIPQKQDANDTSSGESSRHTRYGVSRCCSTYGMEEIFLPTEDQVFVLEGKQKYIFWKVFEYDPWNPSVDETFEKIFLTKKIGERLSSDIHSHLKSFLCTEYHCLVVDIVDDEDKMVTFTIRSDGSLLNIEDFSVRGQLTLIEKVVDIK